MSEGIEYIEPTQEHVGQMVEVRDTGSFNWSPAKLVGIASDDYRFTAKRSFDPHGICWKHARIPRPLTYAERQAHCGLKVGDRVRILTLPESGQDGWKAGVCGSWRHLVGTVHRITNDCKEYGFTVGGWNFPYFVLEKVEDRIPTALDHMAKVYVAGSPQDEFVLTHMFCEIDRELRMSKHFAVVRSGDKRFVYELSNLRVKE